MFFLTKFFPDDPLLLVFQKCLAKNPEDKKHDDKTQFSAIAPPLGGAILFFFWLSRVFVFDKSSKNVEKPKKHKKKKNNIANPTAGVVAESWGVQSFFLVSRGFLQLLVENKKTLIKQKTKKLNYVGPRGSHT